MSAKWWNSCKAKVKKLPCRYTLCAKNLRDPNGWWVLSLCAWAHRHCGPTSSMAPICFCWWWEDTGMPWGSQDRTWDPGWPTGDLNPGPSCCEDLKVHEHGPLRQTTQGCVRHLLKKEKKYSVEIVVWKIRLRWATHYWQIDWKHWSILHTEYIHLNIYLNNLDCKAFNENYFWFAHEKLIVTQGNLYELKVGLPDQ